MVSCPFFPVGVCDSYHVVVSDTNESNHNHEESHPKHGHPDHVIIVVFVHLIIVVIVLESHQTRKHVVGIAVCEVFDTAGSFKETNDFDEHKLDHDVGSQSAVEPDLGSVVQSLAVLLVVIILQEHENPGSMHTDVNHHPEEHGHHVHLSVQ